MVESNNARPIPQIRLEVPDYVAIPGTHKWLHLKGHIAYGRFTDDKWQEHFTSIGNPYTIDVLYHSKSLFAKVGNKEHFPVEFEGGNTNVRPIWRRPIYCRTKRACNRYAYPVC